MICSTQQQLEQLIEQRFVKLSNRLQQVARYLLDHPDTVAFGTTATIATGAGVHASALVRFANAFGLLLVHAPHLVVALRASIATTVATAARKLRH